MINLLTKVESLSGVGPKSSLKLKKLGIETVSDLIFYYPRNYTDFTKIAKIGELANFKSQVTRYKQISNSNDQIPNKVTIKGKIIGIHNKRTSRRKFTVTEAIVEDETGNIKVVWFNQPFLTKMLTVGREVILNGKIEYNFYSKEVVLESPERTLKPVILPVYGETAGVSSKYIAKLVLSIQKAVPGIEEFLPEEIIEKYKLPGIHEALLNIHQPKSGDALDLARRRIAFDELFLISLRANLSKLELKREVAPEIKQKKEAITEFVKGLPYELTGDQNKAAEQILADIEKPVPMNRLLNGDVGSGKTVVAAIAALSAVENGFSVAVMAPTSILAAQHYETFCDLFKDHPEITIGLYTRERQEIDLRIKNKELSSAAGNHDSKFIIHNSNILIGTHALIQKSVDIGNLGLVVVDEQHRFGVKQRGALLGWQSAVGSQQSTQKAAGSKQQTADRMRPHFLSMTATPIPRTLHLALFGDLDLSIIKEKPKNRKEIKTRFVESKNRDKAYQFIGAHIKSGRQAFIICPLIEEKADGESGIIGDERKTVKREYEKLQKIFPEFKVGMLHGKMKAKEKDEIMSEFVKNKINLLVSTSVVEVGVDIPNATIMMIEDAERFGLAQLHQFRGRVGRALHQSFCFLFSSTMSLKAINRLKALESTSDGFKLAEIDLEMRGPGAVFGTEQSGVLDLKMANFSDTMLIEEASSAAKEISESDPELEGHLPLKEKIRDYLLNKHME